MYRVAGAPPFKSKTINKLKIQDVHKNLRFFTNALNNTPATPFVKSEAIKRTDDKASKHGGQDDNFNLNNTNISNSARNIERKENIMNYSQKISNLKKVIFNIFRAEYEVWLFEDRLRLAANNEDISIRSDREDFETAINDCVSIFETSGLRVLEPNEMSAIDEIIYSIRHEISKPDLKSSADEIGVVAALVTDLVVEATTSSKESSTEIIKEFIHKIFKKYPRMKEGLNRALEMISEDQPKQDCLQMKYLSSGGGMGLLN